MTTQRILLSNLGYARGFSGPLGEHLWLSYRHLWCPTSVQKRVLTHLRGLIMRAKADLCCLLEIDTGSLTSGGFNQLEFLKDDTYCYVDAENKYLETSRLREMHLTKGKSNGFIARRPYDYDKLYFNCGTKRLIYRVILENNVTLFFTHFSLTYKVRKDQLAEMEALVKATEGDVMVLGDFNVLQGLHELEPLLANTGMKLLNDTEVPTFFFHRHHLTLDLCLCSPALARRTNLHVIPQAFSDHAALVAEIQVP